MNNLNSFYFEVVVKIYNV